MSAEQPGEIQQPPEKKPEKTINKRLQRTQAQVNEVVDIMRVNIEKVLERDKNLSQLDDRADALQAGASQFEASAGKLKRKFWWRNCKLLLVLCGLLAVIIIVVIVAVTSEKRGASSINGSYPIDSNESSSLSSTFPQSRGGPHDKWALRSGNEEVPPWSAPSPVLQQPSQSAANSLENTDNSSNRSS
uniref:V-SNARE coiled-coil homology domain-containing protein n=1 Tax=Mesocestoides corti TaxID=53468 RepID=A0A5K3FC61_MESCO